MCISHIKFMVQNMCKVNYKSLDVLYTICVKMSHEMENIEKLNVRLTGRVADKFKRIKTYLHLENDTEVVRSLIAWYFREYESDLTGPPKTMWHLNLDENGVLIWDPDLHRGVEIFFNPKGILCEECESDSCKHIQFALSQPDIQDVVRKRRREGWKLPEV